MDTVSFSSLLHQAAQQVFPKASIRISVTHTTRLKAKIELGEDKYVDVFFREETQRFDYALIVASNRVFGLDNLRGWHCHPFGKTDQHVPCAEPTPKEALEQIEEVLNFI